MYKSIQGVAVAGLPVQSAVQLSIKLWTFLKYSLDINIKSIKTENKNAE